MSKRTIEEGVKLYQQELEAMCKKLFILREALELIAGHGGDCEHSTKGRLSCMVDRRRIARYSADRWCNKCIANQALDSAEAVT